MSKRKYKNAAEKQKAYRLRHGQKPKVPIPIRRGEQLGTSEGLLRAKKEGETWEEYEKYITDRVNKARAFDKKSIEKYKVKEDGDSIGAKRGFGKTVEPEFSEEYYELRYKYEKDLEELRKKRRKEKK